MGGTPSLTVSLRASRVNVPVVINIPLSALPIIAPRKSRISGAPTEPI
ncbi:MAG: hypothetical protein VKJ25_21330 [Okeania sp.]|nr:hypothetical protein [Okeania sp.]MEB3343281.1 hypothetical protein [Okeania sp.]